MHDTSSIVQDTHPRWLQVVALAADSQFPPLLSAIETLKSMAIISMQTNVTIGFQNIGNKCISSTSSLTPNCEKTSNKNGRAAPATTNN